MKQYIGLLLILITFGCTPKENTEQHDNQISEMELVLDTKNALGEGAIWNHKTQEFWWIDIEGQTFNVYNPTTKK